MNINKYIIIYNNLVTIVFNKKLSYILFNIKNNIKLRFNLIKLKTIIRKIVIQNDTF